MPVIHSRVVFEFDFVVGGVGAKDSLEFLHHRLLVGMTFQRRVGRRQQAPGSTFVVKLLAQVEDSLF